MQPTRPVTLLMLAAALILAACATEAAPTLIPTPTPGPTATTTPPPPTPTTGPTAAPTEAPPQPTEPPASTAIPTAVSTGPVAAPEEWTPVIRDFEGVAMALVPTGCFTMGSFEGDDDERPAFEMCIEQPYWIDVVEATNGQFGSEGIFGGTERPRDSVSYPEAVEYCAARGARLPTEPEWEYAARSPASYVYPWGNTFEVGNVVFVGSSGGESAPVGSRPGGMSWVGAQDMAGNLWEWTTTLYAYEYPYQADDGRENPLAEDSPRTVRGGAYSTEPGFTRTTSRKSKHPTLEWFGYVGVRCVMDFTGANE